MSTNSSKMIGEAFQSLWNFFASKERRSETASPLVSQTPTGQHGALARQLHSRTSMV